MLNIKFDGNIRLLICDFHIVDSNDEAPSSVATTEELNETMLLESQYVYEDDFEPEDETDIEDNDDDKDDVVDEQVQSNTTESKGNYFIQFHIK